MISVLDLKQKILSGEISDEEIKQFLKGNSSVSHKGNFFKNLLKGFNDNYTVPVIWKLVLEFVLILIIITGTFVLSYTNKINETTTAIILGATLGFLFGKIR